MRNQSPTPTSYTNPDLEDGWEFKVLYSGTSAFRNPEVLGRVKDEEARAGWTLLEKLDDRRLRFKRPVSAGANDANLTLDAYRTTYGVAARWRVLSFWLVILIGAVALYFLLRQ